MNRLLPLITWAFVGITATLVSSCAGSPSYVPPDAAYAPPPSATFDNGSPPGAYHAGPPLGGPQYGLPPGTPQYGPPPSDPRYGLPPGEPQYGLAPVVPQYEPPGAPQYEPPPGDPRYGPPGAAQYGPPLYGPPGTAQYGPPPGDPRYGPSGAAQYRHGGQWMRQACGWDIQRFCANVQPDQGVQCLAARRSELSKGCRSFLGRSGA